MNLEVSLRRQGVKSFAALIREGVETKFVLTNARSACLHVLTS